MTAEVPAAARDLLDDHDAFEGADGEYAVTTTPFDATIQVVPPEAVDDLDDLTSEPADGGESAGGDGAPEDDRAGDPDEAFDEEFDDVDVEADPFEEDAEADSDGDDGDDADQYEAVFVVEVAVPRLDAAVADEDVSPEIENAWHATLELRLEDAYDVAEVDPLEDHRFGLDGEEIRTRFRFASPDARSGVNDAKVIVDFVEGTYLQGVIPGYEYEEPVAGLLQRATQHAEGSSDGAERGGTPL